MQNGDETVIMLLENLSYPHLILILFIPVFLSVGYLFFLRKLFIKYIRNKHLYNTFWWKAIDLLIPALLSGLMCASLSIAITYITQTNTTPIESVEELSEKIERISKELSTSSKELLEIQTELENRIEAVEALKKEAEIAENVISLTEEQVNAIQSKLNQELAASSEQNTLLSIIINAVFFILGIIVQPLLQFIKNKIQKQPQHTIISIDEEAEYSDEEIAQAIKLLNMRDRTR